MELDQSQLVRIVLGRSRDLRAKTFELCAIAKDLRAAVSSRWHCPVCGSIAELIYPSRQPFEGGR